MLYHPELMVYVWLIPVFLFFILPGMIMVPHMVFQLAARCVTYFMRSATVSAQSRDVQNENSLEKRRSPRCCVSGVVADVTDGINSCTGLVCNISKIGIGLMDLPEKIMQKADKLSIIIKGHDGHYPMYLNPQWVDNKGSSLRIGGLIENVPTDWEIFVSSRLATN